MGSFFGGRKSKPSNTPRYATRDEVIQLFLKYYHQMPDEEGIRANMGNPGGVVAIEKMLIDSLPQQGQSEEPIPAAPSYQSGPNKLLLWETGVKRRGMSYWRAINQHRDYYNLKVMLSIDNQIWIASVDKNNLSLISMLATPIAHEGEGCYFSAHEWDKLFIPVGNELRKYTITDWSYETVMQVNGECFQPHTDYYEHNHSCSVRADSGVRAWAVNGREYPLKYDPDECQIDKSGNWLLCKETLKIDANKYDELNRIIYLPTGAERIIHNDEGAVGHSDCGFGTVYGENDVSNLGGALDEIDFTSGSHRLIFSTSIWNMGYFSYTNAKPSGPTFGLLSSSDGRLIKIDIKSGAGITVHTINTHDKDYDRRAKANLCPEGQFAYFVDIDGKAWVVRIP